jgi:NADPH-dependent ferric siderophore reductase
MPDRIPRDYPHATGHLTVRAVERPTPALARITFTGPELARFPDEEPGEIITLMWPAEGAGEVVLPGEGWRFPPGTPAQHARNFTVRALRRSERSVVIDFVLHGPGRASAWAEQARPGDRIGFAGPRLHYVGDPDAPWTLLAGDETALPSIAATLEQLPAGHPTFAVVEVADARERQEISTAAAVSLTWLERDGAPAHRSALPDAVRELDLPDGPGKVWVAGEAGVVRKIREHLRDERALAIGPMQAIGYWKHRETPADVERDLEQERLPS